MNVDEWKEMLLQAIEAKKISPYFREFIGDMLLIAFEDYQIDAKIEDEIEQLEAAASQAAGEEK
jgi:hypothetical protein